jgi:PAS domain S-box-containing protein
MNELVNNILEIIILLTDSRCGYFIHIFDDGFNIPFQCVDEGEQFTELNNYLLRLEKSHIFPEEIITSVEQFDSLKSPQKHCEIFIRKIVTGRNSNSVSLVLISKDKEKFSREKLYLMDNILPIIQKHLHEYLRNFSQKAGEIQPGLSNEWEEKYKQFLSISDDLVFILDDHGCFIEINPSEAGILGHQPGNLIGKHFLEIVSSADSERVIAELKNLADAVTLHLNVNLIMKPEIEVPFSIRLKTSGSGQKKIVYGIAKDLSLQRKYEQELKEIIPKLTEANRLLIIEKSRYNQDVSFINELNRMKSDFVSNVSHELRTPLASIIGFSETIASDPDMPIEMRNEFNRIILEEGKRLAKLINQLLDISGVDDRKLVLQKSRFRLDHTLTKIAEKARRLSEAKGIIFTFEMISQEILIDGDEERIYEALVEIVNNSVKFTNAGGRFTLIVNSLYKEIEIIFSDTGVGIPSKDLPFVFQKYYRAPKKAEEIPGKGLGLVFVNQIIELNKGSVSIQSEAGQGTSVIVKLPKAQ